MTRNEHNGWTNFETFAVSLWLINEQANLNRWLATTAAIQTTAQDGPVLSARESALFQIAELLKKKHEEALPKVDGWAGDLLNAAMSEINWLELAEYLTDYKAN